MYSSPEVGISVGSREPGVDYGRRLLGRRVSAAEAELLGGEYPARGDPAQGLTAGSDPDALARHRGHVVARVVDVGHVAVVVAAVLE